MKKQILNLGKSLTKNEQKLVFGGFLDVGLFATCTPDCPEGQSAQCSGRRCDNVDGIGCTQIDNDGNWSLVNCSSDSLPDESIQPGF